MGFIHEHIILPLSDLAKGEHVHRHLRQLAKLEKVSEQELTDYQEQRLRMLIAHVASDVPFYREWFLDNHLAPSDIRTLADLCRLPIVDKATMRREGVDRFTAGHYPASKRMSARSSGSTGEPFSFYISKEAYSVNMAAKLRTWYQAGYRLGDPYMKIANGARHGRLKTLQDRVNRCIYVPFYSMGDETLAAIVEVGCLRIRRETGLSTVALSGGCMQNLLLVDRCRKRLERQNFHVLLHSMTPPNDGGIGLGQALYAMEQINSLEDL